MKLNAKYILNASCAIVALSAFVGHASAQDTVQTPPAPQPSASDAVSSADAKDSGIVEVVITAQKRTETLSKTPIAVTAYTGDTLKSQGVVNVSGLSTIAPSVAIGKDGFGVTINIRGVTTTDTTSKGEQGISFNVDGVPLGRPTEMQLAFFDLQRVEVLRGPQGTLYGKSSTGGAINVITNKPANAFQASADTEIGSYNTRRLNGMINVPVNDQFAVRVAVNANKRDGYLKLDDGSPARNDEDNASARISALWKPNADVSWLLTYTGGQVRGVGSGAAIYTNVLNGKGKDQLQAIGNPFGASTHEDYGNWNTELNATFGEVKATLLGAHLHFEADDIGSSTNDPAANTSGPFSGFYAWREYRGTVDTNYSELRFSNASPGKLDWVAGINYMKEDIHESDHNWNAPVANPTLAGSQNGIDPLNQTVHTSSGIFAQATWHVTDDLRLTFGARQSKDEVNRIGTFAAGPGPWLDPNGNPCEAPNDCVGGPNNGHQSADKPTWRLGADYQIAPNQMVYGYVATGYKAGGFNDFDPATGGTGTYEPEELTAYEVGYKGRILPNLQFNTDVFYYDYSKDQISSLENIQGNFVIYTRGVPARVSGWENEAHWRAGPADTFDASLVFLRSEYVHMMAGLMADVDWSGYRLDKTPGTSANLGYSHIWTLPDDANFVFHIQSKYSSAYIVSDIQNAIQYHIRPYTRTDLTATYNLKGGNYYIQGYVNNLEDKVQIQSAPGTVPNPAIPLGASVGVSDPQMAGLRFGAKF